MITEISVERKGKETIIDGADVLDGMYVKKGTKFADGGNTEKLQDLFVDFDSQPEELRAITEKYGEMYMSDSMDYSDTRDFLDEVEAIGYTFNYGLDSEPYGLRKKGVKLSELEGYEEDDDEDGDMFADGGSTAKKLEGYAVNLYLPASYGKDKKGVVQKDFERIILVTDGHHGTNSTIMSDKPHLKLVKKNVFGKEILFAEPVNFDVDNKNKMFGGAFVWSSDSRFREDVSERPIQLHDRVEYAKGGGMMADGGGVGNYTYDYYKVPNENLWAIQECNSEFADEFGSECMVIRHKKSEAEAIKEVERLNKMGKHDYYAQGGGVDDEQITLVNGNGKKYSVGMPKIYIAESYINEVALSHILENTGLEFEKSGNGYMYEAQPTSSNQIVALLLTYNYKTRYMNNSLNKNTLVLYFNEERMEEGGMMARGGKLGLKAKYIPNRMITEVSVERNGRETIIDGADILDGFYAKKGVKFADGGSTDDTFTYMMLGRLIADNDYYLGYGNRSERNLWAGNVDDQISEMKKLWNQLPADGKPEWLSMQDILNYEEKMKENKFENGGNIKVGDKVDLPEVKFSNGMTQFEEVRNGEVLYIQDGVYGVKNPQTGRIHNVLLSQIKFENGGSLRPIY